MNLPNEDVHTVEIKYFIQEKEEYGNHETSQLRRLQGTAPDKPYILLLYAVTGGFCLSFGIPPSNT